MNIMKPLLSICIPTHNRAGWLRLALYNWLSQLSGFHEEVELIVSDNASTDNTAEVVCEAKKWGNFTYCRHNEKMPMVKSVHTAAGLAAGEFVWAVGDDDIPCQGAVAKIISVLKSNPKAGFFYLNVCTRNLNEFKGKALILGDLEKLQRVHYFNSNFDDKLFGRLTEMPIVWDYFCSIYALIFKKDTALAAFFPGGAPKEQFSCAEDTVPHSLYIFKNLRDEPVFYIGKPCLIAGQDASWLSESNFEFNFRIAFDLFDEAEKNGFPLPVVGAYRWQHLKAIRGYFKSSVFFRKNITRRDKLILWRFIKRFYKSKIFWAFIFWWCPRAIKHSFVNFIKKLK